MVEPGSLGTLAVSCGSTTTGSGVAKCDGADSGFGAGAAVTSGDGATGKAGATGSGVANTASLWLIASATGSAK